MPTTTLRGSNPETLTHLVPFKAKKQWHYPGLPRIPWKILQPPSISCTRQTYGDWWVKNTGTSLGTNTGSLGPTNGKMCWDAPNYRMLDRYQPTAALFLPCCRGHIGPDCTTVSRNSSCCNWVETRPCHICPIKIVLPCLTRGRCYTLKPTPKLPLREERLNMQAVKKVLFPMKSTNQWTGCSNSPCLLLWVHDLKLSKCENRIGVARNYNEFLFSRTVHPQESVCVSESSWPGWSCSFSSRVFFRGFLSPCPLESNPLWSLSWVELALPNHTNSAPRCDRLSRTDNRHSASLIHFNTPFFPIKHEFNIIKQKIHIT